MSFISTLKSYEIRLLSAPVKVILKFHYLNLFYLIHLILGFSGCFLKSLKHFFASFLFDIFLQTIRNVYISCVHFIISEIYIVQLYNKVQPLFCLVLAGCNVLKYSVKYCSVFRNVD